METGVVRWLGLGSEVRMSEIKAWVYVYDFLAV